MHRLLLIVSTLLLLASFGCSRQGAQLASTGPDGGGPAAMDLAETHAALSIDSNGETYDRFVVVLNSGATNAQRDALMTGLSKQPDQVYSTVYKGFAGYFTKAEAAALKASSSVRIFEKDSYVYAADGWTEDDIMQRAYPWVPLGLVPEPDPGVVKNLSAQTQDWGVQRIGATLNTGNRGSGVTVAVIDTGCDLTHADLAGAYLYQGGQPVSFNAIYPSRPADDAQGHGTHVAGIIGARDNTYGTVGVAPDCNLLAVKVLSDRGWGLNSWVISGIDWVAANAATYSIKAANLSLGGGFHAATNAAIDAGSALGMTYCCAAGNNYGQTANFSPASAAQAIAVSSLQNGTTNPATDYFSTFSNWGTTVEVIAPGTGIFSTFRGNRYATLSGTSMACPHAAGCCALWFSTHTGPGGTGNRTACVTALQTLGYPGTPGGWPTVPGQGRPDPDGVTEPLVIAQFLSVP